MYGYFDLMNEILFLTCQVPQNPDIHSRFEIRQSESFVLTEGEGIFPIGPILQEQISVITVEFFSVLDHVGCGEVLL